MMGLPVRALDDAPPAAPLVSDPPTLTVLAFANLPSDPGQDYFVNGVLDGRTNVLSRYRRPAPTASGCAIRRSVSSAPMRRGWTGQTLLSLDAPD
jgi:hypothetical protein